MQNLCRLVLLCVLAAACGDVVNPNRDSPDAPTDEPDGAPLPDASMDGEPDGEEPPQQVTIAVTPSGSGAGVVVSEPAGITCPGTCSMVVDPGTAVTLSVEPGAGATFDGWSGDCAGSEVACQLVADADLAVGAAFGIETHTVTITKSGGGMGTVSGSGIDCGATCEVTVPYGTLLALSAAPAGADSFAGWGGACSGAGACMVTVTSDVAINAAFIQQNFTLVVSRAGNGSGTVTSNVAGINCGPDCDQEYTSGQQVTLTAVADASSVFTGFSGSGCSGTGPCVVTIGPTNVVTANFALRQYELSVTTTGTGSGRVTSSPAGINCGSDCNETYNHGTLVTLTVAPAVGSEITGFAGCTVTGNTCTTTMTQARAVTVRFSAIAPNIAFITSSDRAASTFGGLAGADAICQTEASRSGLVGTGTGQNPTFVAWLSSSTVNAAARIGASRGWVRTDGKPFIDAMADLATHRVYFPARLTASGTLAPVDADFLTNTNPDGTYASTGPACTSATVGGEYVGTTGTIARGLATGVSSILTNFGSTTCAAERRLLCLGVGRTARVTPTAVAGRKAFTTDGVFSVGGGLAAADALCAAEATAGGLSGRYRALLATNGASAISRFDTLGTPWVRSADGLPLTALARSMGATLTALDTAPNTNAKGNTRFGNSGLWTGAASLTTPGTASTTCNNWTSTASTGTGGRAGDASIATWFAQDPSAACNQTIRKLVCLEE